MADKFHKTMEQLLKIFPQIEEIIAVYAYGSFAREDYSLRHSDLDLLVLLSAQNAGRRAKEKINNRIIPIGLENGVRVHAEYVGAGIKREDYSLIEKILEEGKLVYSTGAIVLGSKQIGLKQYIVYGFSLKRSKNKSAFSKAIHGSSAWYYKKSKKVVKRYKGILESWGLTPLGKGALMVPKHRQKEAEEMFKKFGAEYRILKIVYA